MSKPTRPDEASSTDDSSSAEELLAKVRAKQYALETLAHDKGLHGERSVQITPALERVGRLERELGNVGGARKRYQQALEIEKAAMGAEHPATLECRNALDSIEGEATREDMSGPA